MADDEFDEEELLLVTGRGSKGSKKRQRKADDSDDDEDDRPVQKSAANKRRAAADSDEDSDGMDEEERRKLDSMNELEREMYLFEREELLQRQRERKQVLNQARRTEAEQVEVRASSRRPRNQTGTDSAIGRIAAAHAQREAREKKKQQEEEEKQEKQQRRRKKQQEEEEAEAEEEEADAEEEDEEMEEEDEEEEAELELEPEDEDEQMAGGQAAAHGARAETYDEGTGSYEELEERATLEEIRTITLKRSELEAWHNEPFFEDDVRGCLLRIVYSAEQARTGQPSYLLARIADIVSRNSYTFPAGAKASRTRKWLHMDDLAGNGVFRHQMTMVSNSEVTQAEYDKALAKAQRSHAKFITKGDVQQALERLHHARTFKYNPELVRKLLEKKRAAGKVAGSSAQHRARLVHELNLARQEGKSEEDIQRIQDELDRLEQQERARKQEVEELLAAAAADKEGNERMLQTTRMTTDVGMALVNMRNRNKNNFKVIGNVGAAGSKQSGENDVFSRRHTQSKVYWQTGKQSEAEAAKPSQQLQKQGSGAAEVSLLKGGLKSMEPSELIKVLDLSLDLSQLPPREPGALLPKRLLGMRWLQSVERRQQDMAGRSLLTLDDWKRKMSYQQMM